MGPAAYFLRLDKMQRMRHPTPMSKASIHSPPLRITKIISFFRMAPSSAPAPMAPNSKQHHVHVKRSYKTVISQYCPDRAYISLQIPSHIQTVRRIVFTTVSHDQGFSGGEPHLKGTYGGSFTWFQAAIITPEGRNRVPTRSVQGNIHASFEWKRHVNTWDQRDERKDIRELLEKIRPGDEVQIIPKAQYVAWRNYVKEAEIEVFGEGEVEAEKKDGGDVANSVGVDSWRNIYRPLVTEHQEIRLIKLHSGALDEQEVVCEIAYTQLSSKQRTSYEALSYCWGDPRNPKEITMKADSLDGQKRDYKMPVTSNLYEALRCIRRADGAPRIIWVDAICINQSDLDERRQQVATMTKIYAEAFHVLTWLGQSNEEVKKGFEDVKMVMHRYQESLGKERPASHDLHHPILDVGPNHVENAILEYEYFQRVWVLQEVFNARSVTVYCGTDTIPWSLVLRLNDCINRSMLVANPMRKNVMPPLFASLFELEEMKDSSLGLTYRTRQTRMGILDVIIRGLDLNSTDPRDKLFALLAFGEETSDISALPNEIQPDYSKKVSAVFSDFTRWWITTNGSLQILSTVHLSAGRNWSQVSHTKPSYMEPDSDRPSWSIWHDGIGLWAQSTLVLKPNCPYRASGSTSPNLELLAECIDPRVLPLSGRRIATIAHITHYPYFHAHDGCETLHQVYDEIFDPVNFFGTGRSGIQQQEVSVLRYPMSQEDRETNLYDHFAAHTEFSRMTGGVECHNPCFFSTEENLIRGKAESAEAPAIGLCPAPARVGDLIVILDGGQVPYIVRRKRAGEKGENPERRFEFVGECYLEGIMNGEALEIVGGNKEIFPPEVFELI